MQERDGLAQRQLATGVRRLLSGDGMANTMFGSVYNAEPDEHKKTWYYDDKPDKSRPGQGPSRHVWGRNALNFERWSHSMFTDNYALRVFANRPCLGPSGSLYHRQMLVIAVHKRHSLPRGTVGRCACS